MCEDENLRLICEAGRAGEDAIMSRAQCEARCGEATLAEAADAPKRCQWLELHLSTRNPTGYKCVQVLTHGA